MCADGVCLTSFVHGQNLVTGTYCLSGGLHGEILLGYMCSKSTKQLNLYGLKMINNSHLIKNLLTVSMCNIPLTVLQSHLQLTKLRLIDYNPACIITISVWMGVACSWLARHLHNNGRSSLQSGIQPCFQASTQLFNVRWCYKSVTNHCRGMSNMYNRWLKTSKSWIYKHRSAPPIFPTFIALWRETIAYTLQYMTCKKKVRTTTYYTLRMLYL